MISEALKLGGISIIGIASWIIGATDLDGVVKLVASVGVSMAISGAVLYYGVWYFKRKITASEAKEEAHFKATLEREALALQRENRMAERLDKTEDTLRALEKDYRQTIVEIQEETLKAFNANTEAVKELSLTIKTNRAN